MFIRNACCMSNTAKHQKSVLGSCWVFPANQSHCPDCPFLSTEVYQTQNFSQKVQQSFLYYNVPGKLEHMLLHTNPNKENPNQFFKCSLERKKTIRGKLQGINVANFKKLIIQNLLVRITPNQLFILLVISFKYMAILPQKNRPPSNCSVKIEAGRIAAPSKILVATLGQNSREVVKLQGGGGAFWRAAIAEQSGFRWKISKSNVTNIFEAAHLLSHSEIHV